MDIHDDDELRAALRRTDPHRHPSRLDDTRIRRLVATAERDDSLTSTGRHRPLRTRPRWLLLGGATTTLAAAAAAFAILTPVTTPAGEHTGSGVMLAPPSACPTLSVDQIRANDTAFQGTVTRLDGDTATLQVSKVYAGTPGTTQRLTQIPDDTTGSDTLFTDGKTYLVALSNGAITGCGETGVSTPQLEALFNEAFPPSRTH